MRERFIMRISFIGSIIGLIAIYTIVSHMDYASVKIGSITGEMIGETISLVGSVKDVYVHENGHVFLSLTDETGEIKAVMWSDTAKMLTETIETGMDVNIIGSVKLYKGELEIIARDVKFI